MDQPQQQPPNWMGDLTEREQLQIAHAQSYARDFSRAGDAGHNQYLLIAKLAQKLDDLERRTTMPDPA